MGRYCLKKGGLARASFQAHLIAGFEDGLGRGLNGLCAADDLDRAIGSLDLGHIEPLFPRHFLADAGGGVDDGDGAFFEGGPGDVEGGVDSGFSDCATDFESGLGDCAGGFERVSGNGFATDDSGQRAENKNAGGH